MISGLGFHGNYVEALLSGKWAREIPLWLDLCIDLLVGCAIYAGFELARLGTKAIILVAALILPFAFAWLALVSANRYFDFFLPIELYFLHILYELVAKTFSQSREQAHHSQQEPPGAIAH